MTRRRRLSRRRAGAAALITALTLVLPTLAAGAAGDLDPSFGTSGALHTDLGGQDSAEAVAVQPEGKIVVAGTASGSPSTATDFALARYSKSGALDATFGSGGKVLTDFDGSEDVAFAIAPQPDGKIVVGGTSRSGTDSVLAFALARYNGDGTLDATFGVGGKVVTRLPWGIVNAIGVQPDGKIVAAGSAVTPDGSGREFTLVRYDSDGSIDAGFGSGGKVVWPTVIEAADVAVQSDGKIVAAGSSFSPWGPAIARYNPDGALDPSFGTGGTVTAAFGTWTVTIGSLAVQQDGRLVVAGETTAGTAEDRQFALVRFTAAGALDTAFGSSGWVFTDWGGTTDSAADVVVDGKGRLVVAGQSNAAGSARFAIARYTAAGALDSTFGSAGKALTDFGWPAVARAAAIDEDGNVIAIGRGYLGFAIDATVARYLSESVDADGDGIPDVQDPDMVAAVVSALPDSAFSTGEHARPFLNKLDEIEAMIAAGDLDGARSELQNLLRKVDGCGDTADTNDWIVDCAAQLRVRALIDGLLAHLGT
jgi:uncharacterized delta-60 repeat protein